MYLSRNAKSRLTTLAVFFAPLVVVKLAASVLGVSGPSHADAAQDAPAQNLPPDSSPPPQPAAPTERELLAARHAAELHSLPFNGSPFFYPSQNTGEVDTPVLVAPDATPSFRINGIFVTSSVITAIINGKVCKLGDQLPGSTWTITDIDNNKRTVSIHDSKTGRTIVRSVDASANNPSN